MNNLWIEPKQQIDQFMHKFYEEPQKLEKIRKSFFEKMETTEPTLAHYAIEKIAKDINKIVFTENLDFLHQKTWLDPVLPNTKYFTDTKSIRNIDYIITVWLSCDDRWMLAYIREHNPIMKIISINQEYSNYLSNEDYLLKWDCQKILPELSTMWLK